MAREPKKKLELRAVDENLETRVKVVRLQNRETKDNLRNETPVRLGPQVSHLAPSRLDVPNRDELELRTHQPGVEVLVDDEALSPDMEEVGWGAQSSQKHPVPWGWFALVGLVLVGAAVWSLLQTHDSEVQAGQILVETESLLEKEKREEREAIQLIERISDSINIFFKASKPEDLASIIRHPRRVIPLIKKYSETNEIFQGKLQKIHDMQPYVFADRANFWLASVNLVGGEKKELVIEIDDSGIPLIDWETWVCNQPMPWDQFAKQRPTGQSLDFRVVVSRDTFYSHEFSNSKRWICFHLTAMDSEETLFGYISSDNEEARKLMDIVPESGSSALILRLFVPEGLIARRSVVIEKLVNPLWVFVDPPESVL